MSEAAKVAFIGLGTMGAPMAGNLITAGFSLRLFDIDERALESFRGTGAMFARSIAEAVSGSAFVISMLPDSPQVESVMLGAGGVLETAVAGQTVIDMSTISPIVTQRIAREFALRGIPYLDAPVSGGEKGAREGALSIMVGGNDDAFRRARPLFDAVGRSVNHVGDSGLGQVAKLCNQIVCAMNLQAVCEAFTFGAKMGLDVEKLRSVMLGGAAGSWMLENLGRKILDGDMGAGFRIDLQIKDLRLALESAFEAGVPLPGGSLVASLYLDARAHGEGDNGHQALFKVYERMADLRSGRAQPETR